MTIINIKPKNSLSVKFSVRSQSGYKRFIDILFLNKIELNSIDPEWFTNLPIYQRFQNI